MRPSIASVAKFLFIAAVLFWTWSVAGAGDLYGRMVTRVAAPGILALSGYRVEAIEEKRDGLDVIISKGERREVIPLQPRQMFSGLIPFLALIGAVAAPSLQARLKAAGLGLACLFVFHVCLMLLGPFLATPHEPWVNKIIDVVYGYFGLIGYVALPFILWFVLTRNFGQSQAPLSATAAAPRRGKQTQTR